MKTTDLTVADIMQHQVVTVKPDISVRELARILWEEEISGAPVLDENGMVVGVVSATDVLRLAGEEWVPTFQRRDATKRGGAESEGPDDLDLSEGAPAGAGDELGEEQEEAGGFFRSPDSGLYPGWRTLPDTLPHERLDRTLVRDIMMPATFSVRPESSVASLAGFLRHAKIHRALVFDDGELAGIVTTFDVLDALSGEVEPAAAPPA